MKFLNYLLTEPEELCPVKRPAAKRRAAPVVEPHMLRTPAAARYLGVSEWKLRQMVYQGEIAVVRGKYWLFTITRNWIDGSSGNRGSAMAKMGTVFWRGPWKLDTAGQPLVDKNGRKVPDTSKAGSWWIQYYRDGKAHSESAKTTVKAQAEALLKRRIGEIAHGDFLSPADRRITVRDLYQRLLKDYRSTHKASYIGTLQRWETRVREKDNREHIEPARLQKAFGDLRASAVSTDMLYDYVLKCQKQGLANATINRDLAALKRAFNLGFKYRPRLVVDVPPFPHLNEDAAVRQGFVEEEQYRALASHAPELWLRSLLATAYAFGFRKSELLQMRVNQIDLIGRTIRLWRGTTKNKKPRLIPMTDEVQGLLTACVMGKSPEHYVFSRNGGGRIEGFRKGWASLCKNAGVPGLLFHDLRRSAVRNMIRAGVSEKTAMEISGHTTRAVFLRYDIVSERDLHEAARKIEAASKNRYKTATIEEVPSREMAASA